MPQSQLACSAFDQGRETELAEMAATAAAAAAVAAAILTRPYVPLRAVQLACCRGHPLQLRENNGQQVACADLAVMI